MRHLVAARLAQCRARKKGPSSRFAPASPRAYGTFCAAPRYWALSTKMGDCHAQASQRFRRLGDCSGGGIAGTVHGARPRAAKAGTLTCDISAGIGLIITSKKEVTCMFTPSQPGPREVYTGSISKFGLDIGATTGGEMVWAVYAPTNRRFGALAGHYGGASAEADGRRRSWRQCPGRRLGPHRDAAAGIGTGADRPQRGGRCRRT